MDVSWVSDADFRIGSSARAEAQLPAHLLAELEQPDPEPVVAALSR